MFNNKKNTFEQHDNESISYYRYSVRDLNITNHINKDLDVDVCVKGGGLTYLKRDLMSFYLKLGKLVGALRVEMGGNFQTE